MAVSFAGLTSQSLAPSRPIRLPDATMPPARGAPTASVVGWGSGASSEPAQDRRDLAEDRRVVAVDGREVRVVRQEPHVPVGALERLDRRLVVEHRGHDVAVLGVLLLAHDDPVAVADGGLDHRVAGDLEQEEIALAHELLGQREDVLDDLLGRDRHAGGDLAEHRDIGGLGARVARVGLGVVVVAPWTWHGRVASAVAELLGLRVGRDDLEGPRPVRVASQVALGDEGVELVGDARRAGEADGVADLAHARRVAAPVDGVADDLEHPPLADGETVAGLAIGKLGHAHGVPFVGSSVRVVTLGVGPVSVVAGEVCGVRKDYAVRTQLPNTCSMRVSTSSNIRATTRTDVLSNTCSPDQEQGEVTMSAIVLEAVRQRDTERFAEWATARGVAGAPRPDAAREVVWGASGVGQLTTGRPRLVL